MNGKLTREKATHTRTVFHCLSLLPLLCVAVITLADGWWFVVMEISDVKGTRMMRVDRALRGRWQQHVLVDTT